MALAANGPKLCWTVLVFGRRQEEGSARSTDRRPKSAKARSRGKLGTGPAAVWRFNAGADVDDGRDARTTPAADLHMREVGRVQKAFLAGVRSASTCDPCTDRCDWAERDRRRRGASALEWESRNAHRRSGSRRVDP